MDYTILEQPNVSITRPAAEHAVEAATPVLSQLHLQSSRYKASVDKIDGVYRVGFIDRTAQLGSTLGNPGRVPALQVRIDPLTFKVMGFGPMR